MRCFFGFHRWVYAPTRWWEGDCLVTHYDHLRCVRFLRVVRLR